MSKFKELTDVLGYTYLDRFYEKLSYRISQYQNKDVSALETLRILADEMTFTDDGGLHDIIDNQFCVLEEDDIKFRLQKTNRKTYVVIADDKVIGTCYSLSSNVKGCIEDFFYERTPLLSDTKVIS